jgi:hypothetical protein
MDLRGTSPGQHLNRLMGSLGFPDQLGKVVGSALDAHVSNSANVARKLFDTFSPLVAPQLDRLLSTGFANAGFISRPNLNYAHHFQTNVQGYHNAANAKFVAYQNNIHQYVGSLAQRLQAQNMGAAIQQLATALNTPGAAGLAGNPNLGIEDQLSRLFAGFIDQAQKDFISKLQSLGEGIAPAPVKKKKKKGGILKKVKKGISKGLKKAGKLAKGFGKNMIKGAFKTVKSIFKDGLLNLKGLAGNLFKLGGGLLGGLIGGPLSGVMMDQILKAGGKKNPIAKALGQFQQMVNLTANFSKDFHDTQMRVLKSIIRM